jgi:hypothetical protein
MSAFFDKALSQKSTPTSGGAGNEATAELPRMAEESGGAKPKRVLRIEVFPHSAKIRVGQMLEFVAKAYDTKDIVVERKLKWASTGGSVDQTGLYRAGKLPGNYFVKVADPFSEAQRSVIVEIIE